MCCQGGRNEQLLTPVAPTDLATLDILTDFGGFLRLNSAEGDASQHTIRSSFNAQLFATWRQDQGVSPATAAQADATAYSCTAPSRVMASKRSFSTKAALARPGAAARRTLLWLQPCFCLGHLPPELAGLLGAEGRRAQTQVGLQLLRASGWQSRSATGWQSLSARASCPQRWQ